MFPDNVTHLFRWCGLFLKKYIVNLSEMSRDKAKNEQLAEFPYFILPYLPLTGLDLIVKCVKIRPVFRPEKVPFPSFRSRTSKNLEKIPTPQLAACSYDNCEFTQRLWPVEWSWCPGHKSINSPDKFHSNKNWNPQQQKLNWCSWCTQILVFEWKKNPFMEREWKVMV